MYFSGEFERTLDAKNRLVMPPRFKEQFEDGRFVLWSLPYENFIRVYRCEDWMDIMDKHYLVDDGVDKTKIQQIAARNSLVCEPDGQGRFVVPAKFLKRAGIQRDVVFLGVARRIEIWAAEVYANEPDDFDDDDMRIVIPF